MPKSSVPAVLAIDQGTSSTKAIAVAADGEVVARAAVPLQVTHPRPGWVEQDPRAICDSVVACLQQVRRDESLDIVALGLSNQRESALAWDRATGEPLSAVLGWQDRRTTARAAQLQAHAQDVRRISGLPLDPMFSALKFAWILDQIDPGRSQARAGDIVLGTVDAWLMRCLTGRESIEVGNASRTQLLDVASATWSAELLDLFAIPAAALPPIADSNAPSGPVTHPQLRGQPPIRAVMGDSHAALYAHGVRGPGAVKVTYGTGSSVMGLAVPDAVAPAVGTGAACGDGMVRSIAWSTGTAAHAFEGNILATGATITWLGEVLGLSPAEVDQAAWAVDSSDGVVLVPAFDGLGAPWWDQRASAVLVGMNLGTTAGHLARAALDSIAFQIEDALRAADQAAGARIATVFADGGPSSNDRLMQLQADVSQRCISRSALAELSARGVAQMAGEAVGLFDVTDQGRPSVRHDEFRPLPGQCVPDAAAWEHAVTVARAHRTAGAMGAQIQLGTQAQLDTQSQLGEE